MTTTITMMMTMATTMMRTRISKDNKSLLMIAAVAKV